MVLIPHYSFNRARNTASRQINRWGRDAVLRRVGRADVPVKCTIVEFLPIERVGQVINPLDRKALVASLNPITGEPIAEPDPDRDRLITLKVDPVTGLTLDPPQDDENLGITAKTGRIAMNGIVVFWRLQVRR